MKKAFKKMNIFVKKWRNLGYSKIVDKLVEEDYMEHYFTYINYPIQVRRMIYTTNSIENLNRQFRKVTKTKVTFEQEENLLDLIFMIIKDFEANSWEVYPVNNFQYLIKKEDKKHNYRLPLLTLIAINKVVLFI